MLNWIKSFFKKKPETPFFNVHHPDLKGKFEVAFECKGVKYYRAIKDYILPVGRYKWIDAKLSEVEIRMNLKTLIAYIEEIEKNIDGKTGTINLGRVWQVIHAMKTRTKDLGWEPETVKSLASVIYIDDTEDVQDYDHEYALKKIKFWEDNGNYDFFLTRPISELLNLNDISETSLRKYIQEASEVLKELTLEPEIPLSEST